MKKIGMLLLLILLPFAVIACTQAEEVTQNENGETSNGIHPADNVGATQNKEQSDTAANFDSDTDRDAQTDENAEEGGEPIEEEPGFESPYSFEYPDAVRGLYVTGHSAGGSRFEALVDLIQRTELNAMVIDIKDDDGYITYRPDEDSPYYPYSKNFIGNIEEVLERLAEEQIYPIARIVVFKDKVIAEEKKEWAFLDDGQVWTNNRGHVFINPFLKEVWEYNVELAKKAAALGFQEIQFDYVRFPEGFENRDTSLTYDMGEYSPEPVLDEEGNETDEENMVQPRLDAITDFVAYAKEELDAYDVDVSVDIFGYAATEKVAPGIGQDFARISAEVDVISSMIYPSHWGPHYFGIPKPDLEPYEVVKEYIEVENEILAELDEPPVSRPWLQDFTASWLGSGNYQSYGTQEIEDQIQALNEQGIWEFLLWNANNSYTEDVNYLPIGSQADVENEQDEKEDQVEE